MKLNKFVCALLMGLGHGVWAAGNVSLVVGEANIINRDGQPRAAARGERVVEGETVATGAASEVILQTDDSGVLAIRPLSRVVIEKYQISGTDKDTVTLKLLRGALRSITGWIGQTAPRNYRVLTATATIGIRGTDHETVIAEGGADAGTYDRVYSGETALETTQGSVFLQAGQTGQAQTRDTLPQLLSQAPAGLYPERPTDARLETLKREAQGDQTQRLRARQAQNQRSGGTSAQGNPAISAQCTPNSPAQRALDDFLRAYEQGNVALIRQRLDPALIGYSVLINDIMRDASVQKQTQIRVLERQMQCGPDVSVIDFSWEKRFIDVSTFQPQLQRGRASVLISGLGAGQNGQWRVSGFTGDNPLRTSGQAAAAPATLQAMPAAISYSGLPGICTVMGTANVSASKPYNLFPGCSPFGNGVCNFSNPAFAPASIIGPPATVTSCVPALSTVPAVTAMGVGSAVFSGAPGSVVALSAIVPASGSFGAASIGVNLSCNTTVTISPTAACVTAPTIVPVNFSVSDPARAGQSSVPVLVTGSNGDKETFQLSAAAPGTFSLMSLPVHKGAPVSPGSGRLEFSGPVTYTLSYLGGNGMQVVRPFMVVP